MANTPNTLSEPTDAQYCAGIAVDYLGCISANLNCTVGFLEQAIADRRVIQRVHELAIEAANLAETVRSGI